MRGSDDKGHVLITGTGRAGTTLLMRSLTRAGLDTGFSEKDLNRISGKVSKAGLERSITRETAPSLPVIVKSPQASQTIGAAIDEGWLKVDLVIVPVRKLEDAVKSRVAVQERASSTTKHAVKALGRRIVGKETTEISGGLWNADSAEHQEEVLAKLFYRLIEALTLRDTPMLLLSFPRMASDQDYFTTKLGGYFETRFGLSETSLRQAHSAECNLDFITASSDVNGQYG